MAAVRWLFLLLVVAGIALHGPALGAKRSRRLEKTLKADMVKTFKKQAPTLKFTRVNCMLPEERHHLALQGVFHRRRAPRAITL